MPEQQQYSDLPPGAAVIHDPTQEGQYSDLPPGAKVVTAQPQPQPGLFRRLGQTLGIPTSTQEFQAAVPKNVQDLTDMITPGGVATRMIKNYAGNTEQGFKQGFQEADEAGKALKSGEISLPQAIGKTASAALNSTVNAIPVIGPSMVSMGEDVARKNYPGAIGSGLGIAAQVAAPELTRRVGASPLTSKVGQTAKVLAQPGVNIATEAIKDIPIVRGVLKGAKTFKDVPGKLRDIWAQPEAPPAPAPPAAPPIKSSAWPPAAPRNVIQRAGRQTSKSELADRLETKEMQEQMRRDIEEHGHSAYSQEKRDWFARNQPGTPKGELTAQHPPVTSVPPVKARIVNASGESPASAEAISRVASEKAGGIKRFRVDTRSGKEVPLIGVDAVDAVAGPYDRIVQRGPKGEVTLDEGPKARPVKTMKSSEDLIEGLKSMKAKK